MSVTDIGQMLRYLMVNDSGISAITTRIHPGILPQDVVYPAIRYMQVTGDEDYALSGGTGHFHPRYQIEAWAETYAAAKGLSAAIKTCLGGYLGKVDTVRIRSCLFDSERDFYEESVSCYRIICDYLIWWHTE